MKKSFVIVTLFLAFASPLFAGNCNVTQSSTYNGAKLNSALKCLNSNLIQARSEMEALQSDIDVGVYDSGDNYIDVVKIDSFKDAIKLSNSQFARNYRQEQDTRKSVNSSNRSTKKLLPIRVGQYVVQGEECGNARWADEVRYTLCANVTETPSPC